MAPFRMKTVSVDMFFDRDKVVREADKATRANLSKAGAFVRTAARSSIRKRKSISAPGSPPSSHTGLLRQIFFGWDSQSRTVVVGPMRLNQKIGNAPEALERGGISEIMTGPRRKRRRRRIGVHARPFMLPALKQEAPKFPGLWANSIK